MGRVTGEGRLMTAEREFWVGDLVHDSRTHRDGVVTDVRGGVFVLRLPWSTRGEWDCETSEQLTMLVPREIRLVSREIRVDGS